MEVKVRRPYKSRRVQSFAYTSGGRTEAHSFETNDCAVRALALACSVTYAEAHSFMEARGRRSKKGCYTDKIYPDAELNGFKIVVKPVFIVAGKKAYARYLTVGKWLDFGPLPKRCIMRVTGHVFAVIDGIVMDTFPVAKGRKVFGLYEIISQNNNV
jgi:hypothetical protein